MTRVHGFTIPNPVLLPTGIASGCEVQTSSSGRRILVAMGRLDPQKGFDLLLEAFAALAKRHREWNLKILGAGQQLEALKAQRARLGLDDRVEFAGAVADPFPVLRSADLFVFSSRYEGFGMALAEAMACGLAVVSFDCPEGPSVLIRDGIDGVLVPPEDVNALTATLDRLMADALARERLATRAPEVLDRFGLDRVLELWSDLFERVAPGALAKDKAGSRSTS